MRKFVFGFAFGMAMSGFAALVDGTAYTLGVGETDAFTGTAAIPQFTVDGAFTIGADSTLTISPATDKTSLLATGAGISATLNLEAGATLDIQAYNKSNSNQALALGNLGGTGTVNVANGALLKSVQRIRVGCNGSSAEQRVLPSLGVINLAGTLECVYLELAAFFPNDATTMANTNLYLRPAVINLLPGGILKPTSISVNDAAVGTLNLQGGTWQFVNASSGIFGGGNGLMEINFVDGTTNYLDTGANNVTFSTTKRTHISGTGTLVKQGSGKLELHATMNLFTGPVRVEAGSFFLGVPLAAEQTVYVCSGASFLPAVPDDMMKVTYENESERPAVNPLYTINGDISGGVDLLGYNGTYYTDRLGGSTVGNSPRLEGTVTHSAVSIESPFHLVGQSSTGYLSLSNTGLEQVPLAIDGPGKFLFVGDRELFSEDNDQIQLNNGGEYSQGTNLRLFSTNGTPYRVEGGRLSSQAIWVGDNGTNGSVIVTNGSLYAGTSLDIGGNSGTERFFTTADVEVWKDGLLHSGDMVRFSRTSLNDGSRRGEINSRLTIHDGGKVRGKIYANDDPGVQIRFDGGELEPVPAQTYVIESQQYSSFEVSAPTGKSIIIDSPASATNTLAQSANNPIHLTGAGGFIKRGKGWLKIGNANALDMDYAGDTVLEAGRTSLLGDHLLPFGTGKGILHVMSGATLDLNGKTLTVNDISFNSPSLTNQATGTAELILGADDRNFSALFEIPDNIALGKTGMGTMDVATSGGAGLTVYQGTARLSCHAYSHYRFKVELVYGPSANSMQISEFKLLCDGTDVTRPYQNVSRSGTGKASPAGNPPTQMPETPVSAVDGTLTTKFLDFNGARDNSGSDTLRDQCWLQLDYAEPIRVTHYTWATANDQYDNGTTCRNPMDWRLQGSVDGTTWVDLDVQRGFSTHAGKQAWIEKTFDAGSANTLANTTVKVFEGASLILDDGSFTAGGNILGSVILTNDASLAFSPAGGATVSGSGPLSGNGSLVMNGEGKLVLSGTNSLTGDLVVNSGTVEINPTPKWFRMTIRKTNSSGDAAMQFSEFKLFDADGNRQNLNLTEMTAGTDPVSMQPGTFCTPATYACGNGETVGKLFDANTGTKWCATGVAGLKTGDPSVWRTFTMRLAENAAPVVSYQLTTANDHPERSPSSWLLEASTDGMNWFVADDRTNVPYPATTFTDFNGGTPFALQQSEVGAVLGAEMTVSVATNATLNVLSASEQVAALRVDCQAGGGTISLLNCAPDGALYLTGTTPPARNGYAVPLMIGQTLNANNIKNWTIYFNGEQLAGAGLQIVNNQIVLNAKGLIMMIR